LPVDVELFGQLAIGRPRRTSVSPEPQGTVREVAVALGLDPEAVGLISIDGVQSELDDRVPDSCRLCFFPPMTGG